MRCPSRQITASEIAEALFACGDGAREIGKHEPFGAVGHLCQRQWLARLEQFSR